MDPFSPYAVARAHVNDLLVAADRHVQAGRPAAAYRALWAVFKNVWDNENGITWTGVDARNITDRYALLRAEVLEAEPDLFLPEAPDGRPTEDLKPP